MEPVLWAGDGFSMPMDGAELTGLSEIIAKDK
jgi:hypothetical protein